MATKQYARALFDFEGAQAGDLSFLEDDILVVLEMDDSGWWVGQHEKGGEKGEFPFNYVELISEADVKMMKQQKAQEMIEAEQARMEQDSKVDRVDYVEVLSGEQGKTSVVFNVELKTTSGKVLKAKKTAQDFRILDGDLRVLFPMIDRPLPPQWADNAFISEESVEKRAKALSGYLNKLLGTETTEYLIVSWLDPKAKYAVKAPVKSRVEKARAETDQGEKTVRMSTRQAIKDVPILAKVAFNWLSQDPVELTLNEGDIIAVLNRETPSPGWWEGQLSSGQRGLFPYNHVTLLSAPEAAAVVTGEEAKVDDKEKLAMVGAKKKPPKIDKSTKPRAKKNEPNYALGTLDSFDQLLDDGWTLEVNGQLAPEPESTPPTAGDQVTIDYVQWLWDCQAQQLVELETSAENGPLVFVVGAGDVIVGLEHAVQYLGKGQSVRLTVTPDLAYGAVGNPPTVPPHTHLVYDITLLDFEIAGAVPPPPPPETDDDGDDGIEMYSGKTAFNNKTHKVPPPPATAKVPIDDGPDDQGEDEDEEEEAEPDVPEPEPERKPQTLAEAVAARARAMAKEAAANPPKPNKPVGARKARGGGDDDHKPGGTVQTQFAGRARVEVDLNAPVDSAPVEEPKQKEIVKKYPLDFLQNVVAKKTFKEHDIDPSRVEDYLTDEAFEEAFKCDRAAFLLKPAWRQQAMKKSAGLY